MNRQMLQKILVTGGLGQSLYSRINSWQSSTLVHVGGVKQANFNGTGGGGAAADFTLLIRGYGIFQNTIITTVVVNVVAVSGSTPWKLKIFRWIGGVPGFQFLRESTFMPTATGIQTITLDTPLACAPGDVLAVYCPASNQIYWSDGTRSLKAGYVSGDVTTDNQFSTVSGTKGIVDIDVLGYKPFVSLLGDSIMEGSGNGTIPWYGLYDASFPEEIKTTPGGATTSNPGSYLRSGFGNGSTLQYQNLALGSTSWQRTAETGATLAVSVKPHLTIVSCGSNDIPTLSWAQVEVYMDATRAILAAGGSKMALCEILPRNAFTDIQAELIRTWNTNYATWCAANGVTLIRCHDAMGQTRAATGELDDLKTEYNKDNIHLTYAGVAAFAALIRPHITW